MLKVIIADDEERICRLIQILGPWKALDLEVCAIAFNGIEALDLIQEKKPDILITDIRMPGCDGLELIARARALQPDLQIIVISGYAHFEYARTSIQYGVSDYLLKPINQEELEKALTKCAAQCRAKAQSDQEQHQLLTSRKSLTRLRSNLIRDLVDMQLHELTPEILEERYHFTAGADDKVQALILRMFPEESTLNSAEMTALQERLLDILREGLSGQCRDFVLSVRDGTIYGIMSFPGSQYQQLKKAVRSCRRQLDLQRDLLGTMQLCMAVGTVEDVPGMACSLQHGQTALLEYLTEGTGRILEQIPEPSRLPAQAILDRYTKNIGCAVEVLSLDAAEKAVKKLHEDALSVKDVRGRELMNLIHAAAGIFTAAVLENDRDSLLQDFYRSCDRCCTAEQLFRLLKELQEKLLRQLIEQRDTEESRPICMAKQYIQDHYADAITLNEVAESIGFSGSYFSTFFKKETGSGFNQYLTQVRMSAARELLRTTEEPVAEICRMVGYHDLKHFNRTFHRDSGMTPGEYRKIYR